MGKSNAAAWANRWARGGKPDPLISSVPNRADSPKRKMTRKEYYRNVDKLAEMYPPSTIGVKPVKGKDRF